MEIVGYNKYLEDLYKEFPDVDEKSIRDVVRHGLGLLGMFRKNNHDIYLNNNTENLYYYFGEVTNDVDKRFKLSRKKVRKKMRLVYNLTKPTYSGYYYFSLNDENFTKHENGETIDKVYMFKILAEAKLSKFSKHLFRVKMNETSKWFILKENYETNSAEHI